MNGDAQPLQSAEEHSSDPEKPAHAFAIFIESSDYIASCCRII